MAAVTAAATIVGRAAFAFSAARARHTCFLVVRGGRHSAWVAAVPHRMLASFHVFSVNMTLVVEVEPSVQSGLGHLSPQVVFEESRVLVQESLNQRWNTFL